MRAESTEEIPDTTLINTREDFIQLINWLLIDYQRNGKKWENQTLSSFLEALAAYATDISGSYRYHSQAMDADVASWRVFADILLGATIYE